MPGRHPRGSGETRRITTRMTPDEVAAYDAAARREGLTLSEWIRRTLDEATQEPGARRRARLRLEATIEGLEQDARRMVERARKARG